MACECEYKYIGPWRGSRYRQYFFKDRKIRALTLYSTLHTENMTPEEVAQDYDVPVEAVLESIHYCENNADLLARKLRWNGKSNGGTAGIVFRTYPARTGSRDEAIH